MTLYFMLCQEYNYLRVNLTQKKKKNIFVTYERKTKKNEKKKLNGFREVYHVIYIFQNQFGENSTQLL